MSYRSPPGIRFTLSALVAVCILPVVLVAALLIMNFYEREQKGLALEAISRARAITSAVDRDIAITQAGLPGLSTSSFLADGDFANFHAQARSTLHVMHVESIVLLDASGQLLLSTSRPYGRISYRWTKL